MGFSLESMLEHLEFVLSQDKNDKEKLIELAKVLEDSKRYAKECGVFK